MLVGQVCLMNSGQLKILCEVLDCGSRPSRWERCKRVRKNRACGLSQGNRELTSRHGSVHQRVVYGRGSHQPVIDSIAATKRILAFAVDVPCESQTRTKIGLVAR